MILIDYSGVSIAAIVGFREDLKQDESHIENLIRHVVISTIKSIKQKFHKEYGDVVIACDQSPYWRHDVFRYYKLNRKKSKDNSGIPWDLIHKYMDIVRDEMTQHFPYKVVRVNKAEADDIIGVLIQDVASQITTSNILDDAPQKTLIVSRDKDMGQLLTHPNIRQYNPNEKKFVSLDKSPKQYLRELILTGDSGDGVPNVFSPNDSFATGTRQKQATMKKMQPMLEAKNMLDAAPDDATRQRIIENTQLIALSRVPKELRKAIIAAYNVSPIGNKMTVLKYLASKGMKQMISDLDDF